MIVQVREIPEEGLQLQGEITEDIFELKEDNVANVGGVQYDLHVSIVTGMILAFGSLSSSGGGDPSVFADDISMALVTTAGGLVVALPAIFAYFFMRDKLQSLVAETDDAVEEIMESLRNSLAAYQQQS